MKISRTMFFVFLEGVLNTVYEDTNKLFLFNTSKQMNKSAIADGVLGYKEITTAHYYINRVESGERVDVDFSSFESIKEVDKYINYEKLISTNDYMDEKECFKILKQGLDQHEFLLYAFNLLKTLYLEDKEHKLTGAEIIEIGNKTKIEAEKMTPGRFKK